MAEPRLDPVRWRRPGRSTVLRMGMVAALLVVAALVAWAGPSGGVAPEACAPPTTPARGNADAAGTSSKPEPGDRSSDPQTGPRSSGTQTGPRSSGTQTGALPSDPQTGARRSDPESSGRPPVPDGSVGVPIRLAEQTALALVRPGDRVDLLRVEAAGGTTAIADAALVLGITGVDDPITGGLLIALSPAQAERAVARPGRGFAVLLRPG